MEDSGLIQSSVIATTTKRQHSVVDNAPSDAESYLKKARAMVDSVGDATSSELTGKEHY